MNIDDIHDYWSQIFGRDGKIKSLSSKPLLITTRDALITTMATLTISIIVLIFYNYFTGTIFTWYDYGIFIARVVAVSMAAQYLYEYIGINNMVAESSIRYARGSTLEKYVSRRSALFYECLYKVLTHIDALNSQLRVNLTSAKIKRRFKILKILSVHPDILTLKPRDQKTRERIDLVKSVPDEYLFAVQLLIIRISPPIIYDILINGFTNYTLSDGYKKYIVNEINNDQLQLGIDRGNTIINIIKQENI